MKKIIILTILAISFIIINSVKAEEQPRSLQGIEFLTGYGQGGLKGKEDYRVVPFAVAFDFNLKPLTKKIGFNPPSLVQFQLEPFLSLVTTPDSNMEVGTSFLFKLGLVPESWKFQPYIKFGTGMIYMSQHTLEQSTQFNFISSFGAGLHYFFNEDKAFSLEYRFRHASNAGIKHPNGGIDNHFCLFGVTRLF